MRVINPNNLPLEFKSIVYPIGNKSWRAVCLELDMDVVENSYTKALKTLENDIYRMVYNAREQGHLLKCRAGLDVGDSISHEVTIYII